MKGEQSSIQVYDKNQIVEEVVELYQSNPDDCGFVMKAEVEERFDNGNVYFLHRGGRVACAFDFRHLSRYNHTRIYHTAVAEGFEGEGLRSKLLSSILTESPYGRVVSKVPVGASENSFWEKEGRLFKREVGRKRDLNVWIVEQMDNEQSLMQL